MPSKRRYWVRVLIYRSQFPFTVPNYPVPRAGAVIGRHCRVTGRIQLLARRTHDAIAGRIRIEEVERDELLDFIDRQQLAPTIPRAEIAEAFKRRVRQLQNRDSAEVILENLRPLVGLSLASVVLRVAQRVAAADGQIHPRELQALELIRLIMTSLSANGLPMRLRPYETLGLRLEKQC